MESDGKSFEQLKEFVDKVVEEGRWLIFAGHEMSEPGFQTTQLVSLEKLCEYLNNPTNGIWVDTVTNIASFIEEKR